MKKGIHPNYKKVKVVCTSCGAEFESGSVLDEVRVDTCSNCHPFYTGKQRFASADGRVEWVLGTHFCFGGKNGISCLSKWF